MKIEIRLGRVDANITKVMSNLTKYGEISRVIRDLHLMMTKITGTDLK